MTASATLVDVAGTPAKVSVTRTPPVVYFVVKPPKTLVVICPFKVCVKVVPNRTDEISTPPTQWLVMYTGVDDGFRLAVLDMSVSRTERMVDVGSGKPP